MPVSRPDFLKRIFAQLDMMPCDATDTNLLVFVDGTQELFQIARNLTVESKFREKLCVYRRKGLPNANHIRSRRRRIGEIHNEIKTIVGKCDYLFLLEDDTLFPLNTLERLLKLYTLFPYAGFVTGVQIGRWGINVPGIWQVDNPYEVKRINSMLPPEIGPGATSAAQEIDAAGLFCMLTKRDNYINTKFEPFMDILGPDVTFGIELRKQGYKNYVDWTLNTGHLTKRGEIKVFNTTLQQITFKRIGENSWEQEVV